MPPVKQWQCQGVDSSKFLLKYPWIDTRQASHLSGMHLSFYSISGKKQPIWPFLAIINLCLTVFWIKVDTPDRTEVRMKSLQREVFR